MHWCYECTVLMSIKVIDWLIETNLVCTSDPSNKRNNDVKFGRSSTLMLLVGHQEGFRIFTEYHCSNFWRFPFRALGSRAIQAVVYCCYHYCYCYYDAARAKCIYSNGSDGNNSSSNLHNICFVSQNNTTQTVGRRSSQKSPLLCWIVTTNGRWPSND